MVTKDEDPAKSTERFGDYLKDKADFLHCLLLCHDCAILELPDRNGEINKVLTGASLDEQCLINAIQS